MRKTRVFDRVDFDMMDDHEWADDQVTIVRDNREGGWTCADASITCKRSKTAVKRFFKAVSEAGFANLAEWEPCVLECMQNSVPVMRDVECYSFGVEYLSEGLWYVFLNINNEVYP